MLNLQQITTEVEGKGHRVVDAMLEARTNHNVLVEALNTLSRQISDLSTKLDTSTENTDLSDSINTIQDAVIPDLKQRIARNKQVAEARILEVTNEFNLQHEQLEAHSRRLNIIWNGRAENKQTVPTQWGGTREFEDTEQMFRHFLVTSLHIDQAYVGSMIFRDVHRLPKSAKSTGPPPIIAAFVSQKHRNDVLAAAKHLKDTNFSIKSDLPKRLNEIRGSMLKDKRALKLDGKIIRLIDRNYLPILQQLNQATRKWITIRDIRETRIVNIRVAPGEAPEGGEGGNVPVVAEGGDVSDGADGGDPPVPPVQQ